ncbi:MAG TPA: hypothetical protein VLM44_10925 [Lutibacter sp.]|nr:hypothetical protein [Lutibacter sp.]
MKVLKYFLSAILVVATIWSCTDEDFGNLDFLSTANAPTNVSAFFNVTQDNTGTVTITPNSEGAVSYDVFYGDNTYSPGNVKQGKSIVHVYSEGTYTVKIVATGVTGLTSEMTHNLVVSFKAPKNLVVVIANDLAISKKVNVTATADFAMLFDVYFGEAGNDEPVSANNGGIASYVYKEAGTYTIRVVSKSAAIQTTEYTEVFVVTAILQPLSKAPTPPTRNAADVISIYSSKYVDVAGTNYFPDWGQGGQGSSWAEFDLNGDKMLQYIKLSYQGIALADGVSVNVSGMEFLHMDVWTADLARIQTSLISLSNGEKPVWSTLTADKWTSINIPISAFTDQGLTVADIFQMKFVGDPNAVGTVFIDNIYFWKESTGTPVAGALPIDFENPFTLSSFDGGNISIIENPDTNGNTSANVAKLVKNAGQPWAGSKFTSVTPFEITESTTVTAKVWSPRAGLKLLMKFEDAAPWPATKATAEITATTTVANAWEELTFTITGVDASLEYSNLILIMDNGTQGDGSANYTIYVDDISVASYLDFEPNFELISFDGGNISIIENPDTNGNSSAKVAQLIKNAGQPWAGSKITAETPFALTESIVISAKVWSPRAGLKLLMKFEDAAPWPATKATAEITATTTVANAWETLTFTITGVDASLEYYNLVLIMDNGTQGDGSSNYTIYLDDIAKY